MSNKEEVTLDEEIKDAEQVSEVKKAELPKIKLPTVEEIECLSDYEKFEFIKEELKTADKVEIDGNEYVRVATRLNLFRKYFGLEYAIITERASSSDNNVIFRANIVNVKRNMIVASGHSEKRLVVGGILAVLEFAETASIGRALSSFGIVGGEFASAEEVIGNDRSVAGKAVVSMIEDLIKENGLNRASIEFHLKHKDLKLILKDEAMNLITKIHTEKKVKENAIKRATTPKDKAGEQKQSPKPAVKQSAAKKVKSKSEDDAKSKISLL